MTSIQVPRNIKEQVQSFSVALAWENKQLSMENKMIDPTKVTKVDVLKLERTSPELYYCIRQWKEGALTWEQAANVAIILLLEQNDKLRDELIKTYDYSPLKMISQAMSEASESIYTSEVDSSAHENVLAVQRFREAQKMYECGLITNDEMKTKMREFIESEKQEKTK